LSIVLLLLLAYYYYYFFVLYHALLGYAVTRPLFYCWLSCGLSTDRPFFPNKTNIIYIDDFYGVRNSEHSEI